eukprot:scpid31244/ scgid18280/ Tyrosine-protein phosphatase non-receptor type 4; Testis-enriched protein tyrosine phosphatase
MAALNQRGSYKVRDTTDGPPIPRNVIRANVQLLDDNCLVFDMPRKSQGGELLERLFDKLDLVERSYFGLLYNDDHGLMQWVEDMKSLRKQVTKRERNTPMVYYFRVKFYTPDPSTLSEELTKYQFFLQVRQDLLKGRLDASSSTLAVLGAYIVQSEVGDFEDSSHTDGYVSEFRMFESQNEEDEARVGEQHSQMVGLTPADCERYFLDRAQRLPLYGVEMHAAVDSGDRDLDLGVSSTGLSVFQSNERINHFPWASMHRMTFKKRMFFIHQRAIEETLGSPQVIGFRMLSYRAAKKIWKSCVANHTFFRHQSEQPRKQTSSGLFRVGSRYRYSGRTHFQTMDHARKSVRYDHHVKRTPSKRFERRKNSAGYVPHEASRRRQRQAEIDNLAPREVPKMVGNEMDNGGMRTEKPRPPALTTPVEDYAEPENTAAVTYPSECLTSDGDLIITMKADSQGRYGFNVKGGSDQNQPVTVSRINDDTPAAKTTPPLNVGDELLKINDTDVKELIHDHVVQAIRMSREANPPILTLIIKPASRAVTRREDEALSAVAEMKRQSTTLVGADAGPGEFLRISMEQLQEGLEKDDSVLSHFDQLYRTKPSLPQDDAFIPENFCRNRYRDIAPYNNSRVRIRAQGRDYINASYVKTKVGSGTLNYIAAQGPLPHTLDDFWEMIWEQKNQLIVMVTAEEEGGRTKCECYWPRDKVPILVWDLEVTLVDETTRPGYGMRRTFKVTHLKTNESLEVTQLQYLDWPDHGEPEDSADFINFVLEANKLRIPGQDLLVHCSAGVGRTGMYICMESALGMMKNQEPIYPLEIVQTVRDQRPMVIQTSQQYQFVCRAILKAFSEGMYKSFVLPSPSSSSAPAATAATASLTQSVASAPLQAVDETDGILPTAIHHADEKKKQVVQQRRHESESESDDSDSDSSDSSDDDDDEDDDGAERIDDIRLNPLAMDDD